MLRARFDPVLPFAYSEETGDSFDGWNACEKTVQQVKDAIFSAFSELSRPVFVRDVAFTPAGLCEEEDPEILQPAERYEHAGVPMVSNASLEQ